MGTIKGRTALQVFKQFPYLKEKPYWGNHFWAQGYCVDTVGVDAEMIRQYVKDQEAKEKYFFAIAFVSTVSVLSAAPNGYVDAHLSATELKALLKKTGCDKELNKFFKNMMTGERGKKPSEQCSQLMEGRVKK